MYKYFKDSEIIGLNLKLCDKLEQAREIAGIPFIITSGLRNTHDALEQNKSSQGAHTTGDAVDILCQTSQNREKILKSLLVAGFTRIGIGANHIHADISKTLPQNVVWVETQPGS